MTYADCEPNELEMAVQMQSILASRFDLEEFKTLCFRLGVGFDGLRGEGLDGKARELVTYFQRRRQMNRLMAAIQQYRPDIGV